MKKRRQRKKSKPCNCSSSWGETMVVTVNAVCTEALREHLDKRNFSPS